MRRAGLEVRKWWGRVKREEREESMEARRVERLEAFSMMALGGGLAGALCMEVFVAASNLDMVRDMGFTGQLW